MIQQCRESKMSISTKQGINDRNEEEGGLKDNKYTLNNRNHSK